VPVEIENPVLQEARALPAPGPMWRSRPAIKAASFLTLLLLWSVISRVSGEEIFPGPLAVGASIAEDLVTGAGPGLHISPYHIAVSLLRILCAFAIAMVVGSALGVLMGVNRVCESFLDNWIMVGLTIPGLCWALIALMWFGIHDASAVFAIVMVCLPFVVVNIWEGTKAVDKQLLDMARVFSASRRASSAESPRPTPSRMTAPAPISATRRPSACTIAVTKCHRVTNSPKSPAPRSTSAYPVRPYL